MDGTEQAKVFLGIAVWLGVAIFAVIATANWDPLWGFFPVLAAVIGAWAVGEFVVHPPERGGE